MSRIETIRNTIPELAKDIKLNLQSVLEGGSLTPVQRWGVAVASAAAARHAALRTAVVHDAREEIDAAVIEDALAAAVLMGMNNVYYRFRHLIGNPSYSEKPARLRMNRLAKPATNKTDFELFSLVVSAINGCEACMKAHEKVVLEGGVTEEQVHDAVRIASIIQGTAIALEVADGLSALEST